MITEPELLNERLERLAMVLDEIMPNCALLVRDALELLKEQNRKLESLVSFENGDRVIARNCPFCGSEYRIILKGPSASGAKTEE